MSIRVDPGDTRGPVPALRGTFVTDWHELCRDPHVPLQEEDIGCRCRPWGHSAICCPCRPGGGLQPLCLDADDG